MTMPAFAQDITTLEQIGSVASFSKAENHVTLTCRDNSQVQLTVLAPDLVRVRASFAKPIPAKDHSWAVAKNDWSTPRWSLNESPTQITLTTDELEVTINRSPLLISFRLCSQLAASVHYLGLAQGANGRTMPCLPIPNS